MKLPEEFKDLERFAAWALPTETERSEKRHSSRMEEISEFYTAMHARLSAILDHLSRYDLNELPEDAKRLLHLALSLAEVAPAVEWYNQPAVIDGFDWRRYRATQ